jgi:hypothetical protein
VLSLRIASIWSGVMIIARPSLWQAPNRFAFSRKVRSAITIWRWPSNLTHSVGERPSSRIGDREAGALMMSS